MATCGSCGAFVLALVVDQCVACDDECRDTSLLTDAEHAAAELNAWFDARVLSDVAHYLARDARLALLPPAGGAAYGYGLFVPEAPRSYAPVASRVEAIARQHECDPRDSSSDALTMRAPARVAS